MHELNYNEYKTLVEQSPILIWRSGQDKLCNYFNARWLEFTGRAMEAEIGNGWTEGVHPEDFNHCLNIYVSNFDKRETFEMYYRLKRRDGVYRWIFDRGAPFYDNNNAFMGYIGSCIDVTEQIEAQRELKKINDDKIKELETLLPLCAWCKKIRTDDGEWIKIESYITKFNRQNITHSICTSCKSGFSSSK